MFFISYNRIVHYNTNRFRLYRNNFVKLLAISSGVDDSRTKRVGCSVGTLIILLNNK